MRTFAHILLALGTALAIFEIPTALRPGDGDVEHDWAVAGSILALTLLAISAVLIAIARWRESRRP